MWLSGPRVKIIKRTEVVVLEGQKLMKKYRLTNKK